MNSAAFSPDGKKIVTASSDNTAKIWDAGSGALLADLIGHSGKVISADFSPDGKKIVTASWDNTAKIWDAGSGALLAEIGHSHWVNSAAFSPDGKKIVTTAYKEITAKIWDAGSGALLANLKKHSREVRSAVFSPDGKKIVTASLDNSAKIWDAGSGALLADLKGHFSYLNSAVFSPDGKKIVTASWDNTANIWDGGSGTLLVDLKGHSGCVESAIFSPDGKKIVTASRDNTAKIWNGLNGNLLYTFFAVDSTDYLIVDKNNRYDGTEAARKLLYFTCGTEIIELDQVKDQLWVPNLAERILNGDSINAKTLDELNICGLTPEMEDASNKENEYLFKILPRRGGLGETVLFVNGIETKRYKRADLKNNGGLYELLVKKEELKNYFIPGKENTVSVKAYTADNAISSRGLIITSTDTTRTNSTAPNLYAVMVGVSKYKGDELDLKYAAKDATDISNAIAVASRKLLNADGKEHVFIYNLTTAKEHYQLPEKNSIKKVLEEIGKKATANDILLIFFAGHGVMQGNENKKQFYFLTADASKSSAIDATAEVGISTAELTEWMKPSNIKAQKRIMIFDACNSGQAIKDFVKLGEPGQGYVVARSDEKGQQIKAIEKLNNQSGLFILAASASDQNAYEMGRYSQGLLTYALLKAIKQQPDILENGKYLDVSNWLNAAKKTVSTLAGETGARQEPQLNASNNFNIGMVDDDVRSKIVLSSEKPLFARSNFQNADSKFDNIKLRSAVDKELMSISSRGADGDITYSAEYEGTDAYGLTGEYKIAGDSISTSILLIKGGIEILQRFEIKGNISDINSLAISITNAATAWLKTR
ncbi:MAG: caspase family protein [Chitinophagaceae bacterium]